MNKGAQHFSSSQVSTKAMGSNNLHVSINYLEAAES